MTKNKKKDNPPQKQNQNSLEIEESVEKVESSAEKLLKLLLEAQSVAPEKKEPSSKDAIVTQPPLSEEQNLIKQINDVKKECDQITAQMKKNLEQENINASNKGMLNTTASDIQGITPHNIYAEKTTSPTKILKTLSALYNVSSLTVITSGLLLIKNPQAIQIIKSTLAP